MRIPVGRRHLVVSFVTRADQSGPVDLPMAAEATDAELARLNTLQTVAYDRARWEAAALMHGAVRLRSA